MRHEVMRCVYTRPTSNLIGERSVSWHTTVLECSMAFHPLWGVQRHLHVICFAHSHVRTAAFRMQAASTCA